MLVNIGDMQYDRGCQVLEAPDKPNRFLGATVTSSQEEYRIIPLSKGQSTIVDASDFDRLSQFKWHAVWSPDTNSFYAARGGKNPVTGRQTMISMHREIMGLQVGEPLRVDHKDRDTLNNKRSNLRVCGISENNQNAKKRSDNRSGFKGVYKISNCNRWAAQLTTNGVQRYLGSFKSPEEAHAVVCMERELMHGEFARIA